jgi:hypothetical protein
VASVTFDYSAWAARFPALAATVNGSQATATAIFNDAALTVLDNSDSSPIQDLNARAALFNLLVAHMVVLENRNADGGAGMVGNVQSAGEGSVNVSMASYPVGSGKWYEQTQYGAQYWNAVQPYLRAAYTSGPRPYVGVPRVAGGYGSGWCG